MELPYVAVEQRPKSRVERWLDERWYQLAFWIAVVEAAAILFDVVSFRLAAAVALLAIVGYVVVREKLGSGAARRIGKTAALSQALVLVVPVVLFAAAATALVVVGVIVLLAVAAVAIYLVRR